MNVAQCLTLSTIDGHLGYFQFGVIMSKAAMTVLIYVFWWTEQFRYWYGLSFAPPQKIHMLKFQPLDPQDVTVFGDRVFIAVIKLKRSH